MAEKPDGAECSCIPHERQCAEHAGTPLRARKYAVECDNNGCDGCGYGRTWVVVDPDGIAGGTSYDVTEDAEEIAEMMNEAYRRGVRDGVRAAGRQPNLVLP